MNISDLPEIFKTDIRIKTTAGYYYRHWINCGKKDCPKCHRYNTGHPYWYFYPSKNEDNKVFYLGIPGKKIIGTGGLYIFKKIHIWGKVIRIFPSDFKPIKNVIIYNRGRG